MTGTRTGESISMTMSAPGYQPLNYTGTIQNASTMTGSLGGSGFTDLSITLAK